VVGVFLGTLNVLNCCNAMILCNMVGDTKEASVWADRLEEQFPALKYNAYYLQEQLRHLRHAYPSAYQILAPTDEEFEGLRRRQVDLWAWVFSDSANEKAEPPENTHYTQSLEETLADFQLRRQRLSVGDLTAFRDEAYSQRLALGVSAYGEVLCSALVSMKRYKIIKERLKESGVLPPNRAYSPDEWRVAADAVTQEARRDLGNCMGTFIALQSVKPSEARLDALHFTSLLLIDAAHHYYAGMDHVYEHMSVLEESDMNGAIGFATAFLWIVDQAMVLLHGEIARFQSDDPTLLGRLGLSADVLILLNFSK
jgi:hypothetical protein